MKNKLIASNDIHSIAKNFLALTDRFYPTPIHNAHIKGVIKISCVLANKFNLSNEEKKLLLEAALLHDISRESVNEELRIKTKRFVTKYKVNIITLRSSKMIKYLENLGTPITRNIWNNLHIQIIEHSKKQLLEKLIKFKNPVNKEEFIEDARSIGLVFDGKQFIVGDGLNNNLKILHNHEAISVDIVCEKANQFDFNISESLKLIIKHHGRPYGNFLSKEMDSRLIFLTQIFHMADNIEASNNAERAKNSVRSQNGRLTLNSGNNSTISSLKRRCSERRFPEIIYNTVIEMFLNDDSYLKQAILQSRKGSVEKALLKDLPEVNKKISVLFKNPDNTILFPVDNIDKLMLTTIRTEKERSKLHSILQQALSLKEYFEVDTKFILDMKNHDSKQEALQQYLDILDTDIKSKLDFKLISFWKNAVSSHSILKAIRDILDFIKERHETELQIGLLSDSLKSINKKADVNMQIAALLFDIDKTIFQTAELFNPFFDQRIRNDIFAALISSKIAEILLSYTSLNQSEIKNISFLIRHLRAGPNNVAINDHTILPGVRDNEPIYRSLMLLHAAYLLIK